MKGLVVKVRENVDGKHAKHWVVIRRTETHLKVRLDDTIDLVRSNKVANSRL